MKMKFLAIFLVLLCCLMGAASAAEDISTDAVGDAIDDVIITDEVVDADLQSDDSVSAEPANAGSDMDQSDATIETNDEEGNTRATTVTVNNWAQLAGNASSSGDKTINLASNVNYTPTSQIVFGNNAKIVGTSTSYITGSYSGIPFNGSNTNYHITFENVKFKDLSTTMVMQMLTSGTTVIKGCTFENVNASNTGHNSVIYNNEGTMNITNCVFRNCNAAFGVITNHNASSTTAVIMNVRNCTFENNYGYTEPGCINNCGILNVWDSIFNNNEAYQWAGAIHTHTNAKTVIRNCSFNGNVAGWNGGALYTYSDLEVYDSNFTNNNCSTNSGGGAIGASNYFFASKPYNVTVNNCRFVDNNNLHSNGNGGAIAAMNGGTLYVNGSTFIHNGGKKGQAIAGFNTKQYANISEGEAHLVITNNQFINHTIYTTTTVLLSGVYTFENNTFVNSPQTVYNGSGNVYNAPNPLPSKRQENILGASYQETLSDDKIVNDGDDLTEAIVSLWEEGGNIYLSDGTWSCERKFLSYLEKDIAIIGNQNSFIDSFVLSRGYVDEVGGLMESVENGGGALTFVNVTFKSPISLTGFNYNFVNCTFNSPITLEKILDEKELEYTGDGSRFYEDYWTWEMFVSIFNYKFDGCIFSNYDSDSVIVGYWYANINISDCAFENISVDNVISTSCGPTVIVTGWDGWDPIFENQQAKLIVKDSTFKNTNIKGVVKAQANSADYVTVENNNYDFAKVQEKSVVDDYTYFDVPVSADTTISITNESKVVIITLTAEGKPIAGTTVNYAIGDDQKSDVTDSNGQIKVTEVPDEFEIKVNFAGNNYYNLAEESKVFNFTVPAGDNSTNDTNGSNSTPVTPTKVATKLTASKVTATYNVAKKLVITLKDKNGKALANKKVTVKVGTISKTLTTNSKGQVSLNVATFVPKTYTATVKFAGDSSYSASTVKPKVVVNKAKVKLTAKAKTFKVKAKVKKYTATLKNNKGKVMKNTKLTLKIGKKTYTAKTNKKGVATFKVKLTKKGKNTATLKFAGNKYFKALSKKVKITVKK